MRQKSPISELKALFFVYVVIHVNRSVFNCISFHFKHICISRSHSCKQICLQKILTQEDQVFAHLRTHFAWANSCLHVRMKNRDTQICKRL